MTPAQMVRWSGILLIAGGVCFALFLLVHPYNDVAGAHAAHNRAWIPAHSFHFFGALFTLFGLIGLYFRHFESTGRLGVIGFVLAFIGTAMFVGTGMITATTWPVIADAHPTFVDEDGPMFKDPLTLGATLTTYIFLAAGYAVFGLALWRGKAAPAAACVVLVAGVLLFSVPVEPVGPVPWFVRMGGAVIFGAGLAWLGYRLWAGERAPAIAPAL